MSDSAPASRGLGLQVVLIGLVLIGIGALFGLADWAGTFEGAGIVGVAVGIFGTVAGGLGRGLSKSAVQASIAVLLRRSLIRCATASQTAVPVYSVLRPWRRPRRAS